VSGRPPSLLRAALGGRCPRCGEGALFAGFLAFAPRCSACELGFASADTGDGPAVFVIFAAGAIVVPLAFVLLGFGLAPWLVAALACVATLALCAVLLRPFKAALFALQWRHKAAEGRLERE
jgi:uncharacterized protein (DUF983 family)